MYVIEKHQYENLHLSRGNHFAPDSGLCLMEAVAFVVGEPHSDHPKCVSKTLGTMGRRLNDTLDDTMRQRLKNTIPFLPGTHGDRKDGQRGLRAFDWMVRTWLPTWMDQPDDFVCRTTADLLRGLPPIVDAESLETSKRVLDTAHKHTDGFAPREFVPPPGFGSHTLYTELDARILLGVDGVAGAALDTGRGDMYSLATGIYRSAQCALHASGKDPMSTIGEMQESAIDLFAEMATA